MPSCQPVHQRLKEQSGKFFRYKKGKYLRDEPLPPEKSLYCIDLIERSHGGCANFKEKDFYFLPFLLTETPKGKRLWFRLEKGSDAEGELLKIKRRVLSLGLHKIYTFTEESLNRFSRIEAVPKEIEFLRKNAKDIPCFHSLLSLPGDEEKKLKASLRRKRARVQKELSQAITALETGPKDSLKKEEKKTPALRPCEMDTRTETEEPAKEEFNKPETREAVQKLLLRTAEEERAGTRYKALLEKVYLGRIDKEVFPFLIRDDDFLFFRLFLASSRVRFRLYHRRVFSKILAGEDIKAREEKETLDRICLVKKEGGDDERINPIEASSFKFSFSVLGELFYYLKRSQGEEVSRRSTKMKAYRFLQKLEKTKMISLYDDAYKTFSSSRSFLLTEEFFAKATKGLDLEEFKEEEEESRGEGNFSKVNGKIPAPTEGNFNNWSFAITRHFTSYENYEAFVMENYGNFIREKEDRHPQLKHSWLSHQRRNEKPNFS